MRQILSRIALCFWALALAGAVSAQSINQNVYAFMQGDLWKFDLDSNTSAQLTRTGYNGGPILSPDGGKLAYLATSEAFVARWEAGTSTQTGGTPPANVWIMDVTSETFTLVADQTGASAAGYLRSLPVWSPDSRRLAWIEFDPEGPALETAVLRVYDMGSGDRTTVPRSLDLGIQGDNLRMPSLRWGGGGIARLLYTSAPGSDEPALFVEFIDVDAGALTKYDLGLNANRDNTVRDFIWVDHLGASRLALQIQDYWEVMNPADGNRARLLDPPRLKNRGISGAIQVIPASVANASGDWDIHWYATSGANLYNTGYDSPRVNRNYLPALSPDGTRMAWHNGDHISSWNIGLAEGNRALASDASHRRAFPIPQPVSVVWAPTEWITTGAVAGAPVSQISAACALTPLLSAGDEAIVSPDVTLRIRSDASTTGSELARAESGSVLTIQAGPICADGYHWYAVHDDELAGWSAEGGGGEYWLLYHLACADSPPTRLTTGMTAAVSGDRVVNIRSSPGAADTQVVWAVAAGEEFDVAGLPQCGAAGLRWYPIRRDQVSGWIAEGQGDEYWIEPVADQSR
ncbi:MAG: hypothetical protein OXG78_14010 [Chloroflexi bacterium]|nr:hypothetical protein [Chloroflexota bacterium]